MQQTLYILSPYLTGLLTGVVISPFTDKETDFQRRNFLKVTLLVSKN